MPVRLTVPDTQNDVVADAGTATAPKAAIPAVSAISTRAIARSRWRGSNSGVSRTSGGSPGVS
jgi:hypothetical protein